MTVPELVDDDSVLVVHVACWETALGLVTSLSVPVSNIQAARAAAPWSSQEEDLCPGLRVGLGIPFVKLLGRKVDFGTRPVFVDCSAGATPLLVVDVKPGKGQYRRLVITTHRAEELAQRISAKVTQGGAAVKDASDTDDGSL
jgi:hypothetical protein